MEVYGGEVNRLIEEFISEVEGFISEADRRGVFG